MEIGDTNKKIEKYFRVIIKDLLEQCTKQQQSLFFKMYGDIETMIFYTGSEITNMITQLERTIIKNEENEIKYEVKKICVMINNLKEAIISSDCNIYHFEKIYGKVLFSEMKILTDYCNLLIENEVLKRKLKEADKLKNIRILETKEGK